MGTHLNAESLRRAGVHHGFSTRRGGVSEPPFDSLNLGRSVGDDADAVAENHRRLAAAVGYAPAALYEVSQVHGSRCITVTADDAPADVRRQEADALVSAAPDVALGVRTADCLPVLWADPEAGVVGASHAGWRGVEAGVLVQTLSALVDLGAAVTRLSVALGPHIGPCCFEVGDDVAERIALAAHESGVIVPRTPRPHVDLARAVVAQLVSHGIPEEAIEQVGGCTLCDEAGRFFSYRRDGARSGRMLAVIARAPAD